MNRHVKLRGERHEKDDREKSVDPRFFVLGWDNREKCRLLAEEIHRLLANKQTLDEQSETVAKAIVPIAREARRRRSGSGAHGL